jgi:lysophospholipase L1-like esterase
VTSRREFGRLLAGAPFALEAIGARPARAQAASASSPKGALKVAARSKLVMIGDSITDAGRARPGSDPGGGPLGRGYVAMVDTLLAAVYPDQPVWIVNTGISGNTVRDLKARWQADVIDLKPDWLSVMIGTNDVWRQFDSPRQPDKAVPIDEYEQTLAELLTRTKPTLKGLVLLTPFYLEPNRQEPMRAQMDRYGSVVRRLASAQGALFVDTQAAFDEVLAAAYTANFSRDRVHPNDAGAMVLARAFVNAIGFSWVR